MTDHVSAKVDVRRKAPHSKARFAGYFLLVMAVAWALVIRFSPYMVGMLFAHEFQVSSWIVTMLLVPIFAVVGAFWVSLSFTVPQSTTMRVLLGIAVFVGFGFLIWSSAGVLLGTFGMDIHWNRSALGVLSLALGLFGLACIVWQRRRVRLER